MNKISNWVIKYRWVIIVLVSLLSVFLGYQIKNVQVNSNVIESLPDHDPEVKLSKRWEISLAETKWA